MPITVENNNEKVIPQMKLNNDSSSSIIGNENGDEIKNHHDDINIGGSEQDKITEKNIENVNEEKMSDNNFRFNGVVSITDPNAPLIILFGPTSCGKTMTLIRLTRYLREQGYIVEPDRSFRPSSDKAYEEDCKKFNQTVNDPIAAAGTSGYMLVNVILEGRMLCKILEAPGEYYFDPDDPQKQYPHYMQTIMMAKNKKVWCAFVEPDWREPKIRAEYVKRISALKPSMRTRDKMVFIFNKIDQTHFVRAQGVVDEKLAVNEIRNFYPGIFAQFKCTLPIIKWFREYDCSFIPFQTGTYTEDVDDDGNVVTLYAVGPEEYAIKLWSELRRNI